MGIINHTHYKLKEHRIENNEAKNSVLVEQDRCSKRQKLNDNRSNECMICGNKTCRKDSKFTDYVKMKEQNCFYVQQGLMGMQFSPKYESLIKLKIYFQLILWVKSSA